MSARSTSRSSIRVAGVIAVVALAAAATYVAITSVQPPPTPPSGPKIVYLYLHPGLNNTLAADIAQYTQDVNASGYEVRVHVWCPDTPMDLKNNLTQAYTTLGIEGAIFVGNMPYILRNDTATGEEFVQDLFFMDLDGSWNDTDDNGIYDSHTAGSGDILPEIWVARISPEGLSTYSDQLYHDYFGRLHAYRTGALARPHSMLVYQEDTWATINWLPNLTAYSNVTWCNDTASTTAANYLANITTVEYEFVHLFCHSYYNRQLHEPYGLANELNSTQIKNANKTPLFYNLYCCSAATWVLSDCLATSYLFSNSTLVVIGSARNNGGMTMNEFFYGPLGQNMTFGEAFKRWWTPNWENLHGPAKSVSMGMCLLGDPLLTIF